MLLLLSTQLYAQHFSKLTVEVDSKKNTLNVLQELTYYNETNDTLSSILLNDWNNAYSDKNSLLGRRFSDEFVRSFHLAKEKDRGNTNTITIIDDGNLFLDWYRPEKYTDLIEVPLRKKMLPHEKRIFHLTYFVKIPNSRFTKYGFDERGSMNLKDWFLTPARYENHAFVRNSNANLDDIANGLSDFELGIKIPKNYLLNSDLDDVSSRKDLESIYFTLSGKNRTHFSLFLEPKSEFYSYKNDDINVLTNLRENQLDDIQKAMVIDRVVNYVKEQIGTYPNKKITVSEADYERNPFYGLNQLPSVISLFPDEFLFELKFLKTYTNNYLKNTIHLDPRKDNWIYDAIQVYTMMNYIDEYHPKVKMMGSLAKYKLLKSFNLINLDFNEQYSYYYMLMARKNLDQPLSNSKETLIRFNEKIASKYRAGLSLKYLDNYLNDSIVPKTIREFYLANTAKPTYSNMLEQLLKKNAPKKIDWFFTTIINSRDLVDYKFENVSKTNDSVTFTIKNKTGTTVPIPVYGIKGKSIVFKKWFENIQKDSTFTIERQQADKIVLNYKNEVPEYNLRNNWKSIQGFLTSNRPFKFVFMKDLEDPYYNQILYVPTVEYNLYDGLYPGIRFHNKSILDKPIVFDANPAFTTNTNSVIGSASFLVNQYIRDSRLYNIRYAISTSYYHYAQDATYLKINPLVSFSIREKNIRDNRKQSIGMRYSIVQKERSQFVENTVEDNYSIFSLTYSNTKSEITNHVNFYNTMQLSSGFGKISSEIQFRKLFNNNRQINLRLFAGSFLYSTLNNSNSYNFGIDAPNDYLFDYNLFGRSEKSGLFSQQFLMAEGGFKSKVIPNLANQWLVATNGSFNVWNWVELYGDLGMVKNKGVSEKWIYDSGVRLNLVTDYFELYLPVYSNLGWEISQPQYSQKIRFIFTFDPKTLINLFTRKWF